jgi:hypothetical protein
LLTSDVLDVWEYWQKVHVEAKHGKARTIGKDAVKAIHEALQWEPSSADECPDGWTVKRLLCTVLAYAYRAPDGSPGVDWWRSSERRGSDLNPETLLRLGRDAKLPRNARWAVAWSLAQRSPSLQVLDGGKPATVDLDALALRLWNAYYGGPNRHRAELEEVLGGPAVYDEWIRVSRGVLNPMAIPTMQGSDLPFRKRDYLKVVRAWLAESVRAVA